MEYVVLVLISLIGIFKSADVFVKNSVALAKKYKLSTFLVGFTIVSFATTLPEFVIALYSTHSGSPEIAVSSVIGCLIANTSLVLGILALYKPYKLTLRDIRYNIPINVFAVLFFSFLVFIGRGTLNAFSGIVLIAVFVLILIFLQKNDKTVSIYSETKFSLLTFFLSLLFLVIFGKLVVDNILRVSALFGVNQSILGYFVIAIASSLPELVTTLAAVKHDNREIGLGNILGSNLFNLLFILGLTAILQPLQLMTFVNEIILIVLIMLFLFAIAIVGKKYYFTRLEGGFMLLFYLLFIVLQFL